MNSHRILVVDDHPLFRKGVTQLLAMEPDLEVVGEAGDHARAVQLAGELDPDLILLDLHLKGSDGLQVLEALKQDDPSRRVVMLTVSDAAEDLMAAIRAGADGYLLKDAEPEQLLQRIHEAAEGRTVFSEAMSAQLAAALHDEARRARGDPEGAPDLTARELAVLRCVARGASNKVIGRELNIAEGTVKVHVKRLMKKLGFRSRVEAAIWATRRGLHDEQ